MLKQGVIIGHDNRANSDFFAKVTYDVLRAHQIKAFLFEANELQPSPLVSYTVRKLSLAGGIVITAVTILSSTTGLKFTTIWVVNLRARLLKKFKPTWFKLIRFKWSEKLVAMPTLVKTSWKVTSKHFYNCGKDPMIRKF
ncbi:hypothetical protein [Mycoplasma sp. ATU-Cv-508]|uniref:hypothetical protein n=1 Tax=Mycoplasma sp. ATU-Cv-508 TaxID=2048001 RepID=UPI000FDD386E